MLRQYLIDNKIGQESFAKKIGISHKSLFLIFKNKSPNTKVKICVAIEKETGLRPHQYLNHLDNLKNIILT